MFVQHVIIAPKQEIIKVRERILHISLVPKVMLFKLFLGILPTSSTDITGRLLAGGMVVRQYQMD